MRSWMRSTRHYTGFNTNINTDLLTIAIFLEAVARRCASVDPIIASFLGDTGRWAYGRSRCCLIAFLDAFDSSSHRLQYEHKYGPTHLSTLPCSCGSKVCLGRPLIASFLGGYVEMGLRTKSVSFHCVLGCVRLVMTPASIRT